MKLVARHQLTHKLTSVTEPVSEECGLVLKEVYTDNPGKAPMSSAVKPLECITDKCSISEWHDVVAKEANLQLMARISSRVFLGAEMCRNPQWLRITATYTVIAFRAVEELRLWPSMLRPVVQWFLPHCSEARALVQEARSLINPLLERRQTEKAEAAERGDEVTYNDAIEWLEQTALEKDVPYDPACAQLSLSVAALHSTTDFFTQVMFDIAKNPELIQPLRDEVISVLGQHGWSKHSLYNLKLMDSVLKESQRLKPIAIGMCLMSLRIGKLI